MRSVSSAQLTLLTAGTSIAFAFRVQVENPDGGLTDLSNLFGYNFVKKLSWTENIDQPVATGTVTLFREFTGPSGEVFSLSPTVGASLLNRDAGGSYARLLRAGRRIRIDTAWSLPGTVPAGGDWLEVFSGKIDLVDWKGLAPEVVLTIRDAGAWVIDNFIQIERDYSTDDGVSVQSVMQAILDDNTDPKIGPVALYVPVNPGWNIRKYTQARKGTLDALRDLALQIGWDVRYRWDSANLFRLTFAQPDREKSAPDWTLGPDRYFDVTALSEGDANVRNRIHAVATDASGVKLESTANDTDSQTAFGMRFMEVAEDSSSNIDTQGELDAMTAAIKADLAQPRADQEVENLFFPVAEVGDLGRWLANGKHYDNDQFLAVVQVRHEITPTSHRSFIQTRGSVAGAYYEWLRRQGSATLGADTTAIPAKLDNWREIRRTGDDITFGFDPNAQVDAIAVYEFVQGDTDDVTWPDGTTPPTRTFTKDTVEITFPFPPAGNVRYAQVMPIDAAKHYGEMIRQRVFATGTPPKIENEAQETAISGLFTAVSFDVIDYQSLGGTLRAWTNPTSEDSANSSTAPDGTVAIAATPAHVDGSTAFTLASGGTADLLSNVPVHPGRGKRVYFEFTNSKGVSSGVIAVNLLSQGGIIDENGKLLPGTISDAAQFAASIAPVQVLATLPATAPDNTLVFNTTDGQLYRRTGGSWSLEVKAQNITGQLVTTQIADAAINVAKFALGLKPVELLTSTSGAPGLNRIAYNTTDGKLYKSSASGLAWETAGAGTFGELAGQITTTQITPGAITSPLLAANSVTAAAILAGTITSGLIAAGAITTTELAAGAVNTAKLAAGAVTAFTIAGGTITGTNIAGGTITGGNIAANTITAGNLTANSVTAGKIAAGAINSSSLFVSGVVTATIIQVSNLAAISSNLGIIVSGKLNSANGQSYIDLNATGSSPFIHHASSLGVTSLEVLANGTATFYGTVAASTFTSPTVNLTTSGSHINFTGGGCTVEFFSIVGISSGILWHASGGGAADIRSGGVGIGMTLNGGTLNIDGNDVSYGPADSAGSGFRWMRVPN